MNQQKHDPEYHLNRARFLEYLYRLSGRDNPAHPQHSLYTGLYQEHALSVGMHCLDVLVRDWTRSGHELVAELDAHRAEQVGAA